MKFIIARIFICVCFGIFFIKITQPFGLAITTDSVSYIEIAKNVAKGKGVVDNYGEIVSHWPPLFPVLIGLTAYILELEVVRVGVYFNLALIIILAWTFGSILKKIKINNYINLIFVVLLLFSIPNTEFLYFLSDGLFTVLLSIIVLHVISWTQKITYNNLLFTGFLLSLLILTRYAAVGIIGGFVIYLLLRNKDLLKSKLVNIVVLLLPVIFVLSLWFLFTNSINSSYTDRSIHLSSIDWLKINFGIRVLIDWFVYNYLVALGFLIFVSLNIYFLIRKNSNVAIDFKRPFLRSLLLPNILILSYLLFLTVSISVFDSHTPLDYRILMPIYFLALMVIATFINYFFELKTNILVNILLLTLLIFSVTYSSNNIWRNHFNAGFGYSGKEWGKSEIVNYLNNLDNRHIYSNGRDVIMFFTSKTSEFVPRWKSPTTGKINQNFHNEVQSIKSEIKTKQSQLIFFDRIHWRNYLISKEVLLDEFNEFDIVEFSDGMIIR